MKWLYVVFYGINLMFIGGWVGKILGIIFFGWIGYANLSWSESSLVQPVLISLSLTTQRAHSLTQGIWTTSSEYLENAIISSVSSGSLTSVQRALTFQYWRDSLVVWNHESVNHSVTLIIIQDLVVAKGSQASTRTLFQ